jgi:hypothetical protein
MQPIIESSVVFPLPDGPMSSRTSLRYTSRSTPLKARTAAAPDPKIFATALTDATGSPLEFKI